MLAADCLPATVIRAPQRLPALSGEEWDMLIRQGRRANLLARIAYLARTGSFEAELPPAPRAAICEQRKRLPPAKFRPFATNSRNSPRRSIVPACGQCSSRVRLIWRPTYHARGDVFSEIST